MKSTLLSLSILLCLTAPVIAADTTDTAAIQTKDIVVTATRTEEEVKNVPSTVEVITQEDIERNGATDVWSALRLASDVNVTPADMVGHNIMIRGMANKHTLVLIDGKRTAGEDVSGTQNVYALDRLSLSNIDRIEIIRGSASAIYGSDAIGGVINIITKKSTKPATTVGLSTGKKNIDNYYHIDFGKSGNFSGSLDMRFTKLRKIAENDAGSESTNSYGPRRNFAFSGTYDLSDHQAIDFDASYFRENSHSDLTGVDETGNAQDDIQKYDSTRNDYSLAYRGKTDTSDYLLRAYYSKLNKDQTTRDFGKLSDWDKMVFYTSGIEGKDSIQVSDKHLVTFGGEYIKNTVKGSRIDGGSAHDVTIEGLTKAYGDKDVSTYAAYLQDEWMPNDKLLIIPSVRYDHHSAFGSKTSPKVGVTYFINQHNRLKVNYGKGFRAPSLSELYFHMNKTPIPIMTVIINGNPNLKPEESTNFDISYELDNDTSWGKFTYFHNDVDNLISSGTATITRIPGRPVHIISTSTYENIDKAKVQGFEVEAGHHFNDSWQVKATANWIDARDKSDDSRLSDRARNTTTLQFIYDDQKPNGFNAILWEEWVNSYRGTSIVTGEAADFTYSTTNIVVNKKFGEGTRVFAGLDNIFNKKIDDISLDGRVWRAGVEWTF